MDIMDILIWLNQVERAGEPVPQPESGNETASEQLPP